MTKVTHLEVVSWDGGSLKAWAKKWSPNVNDKGTMYAGAILGSEAVLGWALCNLLAEEYGIDGIEVAVVSCNVGFSSPIEGAMEVIATSPGKDELESLSRKVSDKGKGSLKVRCECKWKGAVCSSYEGIYVISKTPV